MSSQSSGLLIRDAEERDLPDIVAIYNHYVLNSTATFDLEVQSLEDRAAWLAEQKKNGLPVLVMEAEKSEKAGDKIIGFASLSYFHKRCAYKLTVEPSMYLSSASCHNGFGKQLMNSLMTAAGKKGYHAIVALVCSENLASIKLARANGFELVGQLKEVGRKFDRFLDVSILQKVL